MVEIDKVIMSKKMRRRAINLFEKMIPVMLIFVSFFIFLRQAAIEDGVTQPIISQRIFQILVDLVLSFNFSNRFMVANTLVLMVTVLSIYRYWIPEFNFSEEDDKKIKRVVLASLLFLFLRHVKPDSPAGLILDILLILSIAYPFYAITWIISH